MKRLFETILPGTYTFSGYVKPPRRVTSLGVFGTHAFSFHIMLHCIRFLDRNIQLDAWFKLHVPRHYQEPVLKLAQELCKHEFKGRRANDENRYAFVESLRLAIFTHLEPHVAVP